MSRRIDFEAILRFSPNPYMLLDRELRFVFANDAYLRVTARERKDLIGRHVFDVFPHDADDPGNESATRLRESLERVLASGDPDVLAFIPYKVDRPGAPAIAQNERYWSATHTPILDEAGTVAFILQHTVDVTQLRVARQATPEPNETVAPQVAAGVLHRAQLVQETNLSLDAERRHLRRLFEQAPGFVCFLRGRNHVFELANTAYYQVIGHRDIIGKPFREALPEVADQGYAEQLDHVFVTGEPRSGRGERMLLQRQPGGALDEVFIDMVLQPIVDPNGMVTGIFVQGHEVTEQERLKTQLEGLLERERSAREDAESARVEAERANRLKDEFLATLSHELRTPLNALLGWARLLRTRALSDEARHRAAEVIERNAALQAQLVEDILDVSRIVTGKLRLRLQRFDLRQVVETAVEIVKPAADAKGVMLLCEDEGDAALIGDPDRLQQVVWNLLSNAVKFTPSGGLVRVALRTVDGAIELSVIDTGDGITKEFLPHVFERFRQADPGFGRVHGGLGLGLAVVKHLVEAHGGEVSVSSEGPGTGATFTARLPVSAALRAADRDSSERVGNFRLKASTPGSRLKDVRVLVVDDNRDTLELLVQILADEGADVSTATSAADALRRLSQAPPDVLVSDIGLPGTDGLDMIRELRRRGPEQGGDVPAAAVSAYARAEDRARALQDGFQVYLPKPVDPTDLVHAIADLAGSSSAVASAVTDL